MTEQIDQCCGHAPSISMPNLLEAAAERWPTSPSVTCGGTTYRWQDTLDRTRRMAQVLSGRVSPGDRVAYLGLNSHWCFELFFAVPWAGAIMLPLNFRWSADEMKACMEDAEPTVLVVDDHHVALGEAVAQACPGLRLLIHAGTDESPETMVDYETLLSEASGRPLRPSGNDDTLILFYTGGTTGRSKGVMLSHINQYTNALGGVAWYRMREREAHLLASPMFHAAAGSRVYTATMTGTHTVILPRFEVADAMATIEKHRINTLQIVPTMLQSMLEHPRFRAFDVSSLRLITYGAAPMPVALLEKALAALPGVSFAQSYGMTEASPVVTVLDGDDHGLTPECLARLESVGRPVFHNHVRIVDGRRRPLARGQTGEVAVRGASIMKGYWRAPELTADVLCDGWYHTGDCGYLDEAGYLFLTGRIKDMIVSGGENVYPIEIENILSRHPAIRECAVVGIPHDKWGETVHAVVRLLDGASLGEEDLIAYCRERIAHYKCPTGVTFLSEPFPVSTVNKVMKTVLRDRLRMSGSGSGI